MGTGTAQFILDRMNEEPHPQSSNILGKLITHLDLIDAWRVKYPYVEQYTWVRVTDNTIRAARLDRIYTSQSIRSGLVSSSISPVRFNDHHLTTINVCASPGK